MKPHKHAEVIKAWADGAEIEWRNDEWSSWRYESYPTWEVYLQYRVKPDVKPDVQVYARIVLENSTSLCRIADSEPFMQNIHLVFDGETGKLKSAEIIG